MRAAVLALALSLLPACSESSPKVQIAPTLPEPTRLVPADYLEGDPVEAMGRAAEHVRARQELGMDEVQVRHLLVSFAGAGVPGVTRSQHEAERLAAELYRRVLAGEALSTLVAENSDDKGETYIMHADDPPPGTKGFWRRRMVPSFGGYSWKLLPGEVVVTPYDPVKSPYGWHIIERLR